MNKMIKKLSTVLLAALLVVTTSGVNPVRAEGSVKVNARATNEQIDAANELANTALEGLGIYVGKVTKDNLEEVKTVVAKATKLMNDAKALDSSTTYYTYYLEQLVEELKAFEPVVNPQIAIDEAINKANKSIEKLEKIEFIDSEETKKTAIQLIQETKDLIKAANALDPNVSFASTGYEYTITNIQKMIHLFDNPITNDEIDRVVGLANKAILELDGYIGKVTVANTAKIEAKIAEVKTLVEAAQAIDKNVTFEYKYTVGLLKAEIVAANQAELDRALADEAIAKANTALAELDAKVGNLKFEEISDTKAMISHARLLVAKAMKLDPVVTFNEAEFIFTTLQTEMAKLAADRLTADEAIDAANTAIAELEAFVENVTELNKDKVVAKIAEVKALVAAAEELDSVVAFTTYEYTISLLEKELQVLQLELNEKIDLAVAKAQTAIDELADLELTRSTKFEVVEAIKEAKILIAEAHALDANVVFDTYPLEVKEAAVAALEAKIEETDKAIDAANVAIAELEAFVGNVSELNKDEVIAQIAKVKELVAIAEAMDSHVVFTYEYSITLLEAELQVIQIAKQEKIDAAVAKANTAIEELEAFVGKVTEENKLEVLTKIEQVKDLVAAAQALDSNVVFTYEYTISELEAEMLVLQMAKQAIIDAAAAKANAAIEKLEAFLGNVSFENQEEILALIEEVKTLVAAAEALDANIVFTYEYTISELEAEMLALQIAKQAVIDAAVAKANAAIAKLEKFEGKVSLENQDEVLALIEEVKSLVAAAEALDANVVFDYEYTVALLEAEILALKIGQQAVIDAAVAKANEAIAKLEGFLGNVSYENQDEVKALIEEVKMLVAVAEALDENVVFDYEYTISELEAEMHDLQIALQAKIDALVALANQAIAEMEAFLGNVTSANKDAVIAKIKEVRELVAAAEAIDKNVVFDYEYTIGQLTLELDALNIPWTELTPSTPIVKDEVTPGTPSTPGTSLPQTPGSVLPNTGIASTFPSIGLSIIGLGMGMIALRKKEEK